MLDRLAQFRFRVARSLLDTALRLAVLASARSDRVWRWKNRQAGGMVMACALGGPVDLFDIPDYPITILARVADGVDRLELHAWDAATSPGDGWRREDFAPVPNLPAAPMFGRGGIHMFMTQDREGDRRYFVRAYRDGQSADSDIVFAKIAATPTERRDATLHVTETKSPRFSWPRPGGNVWISFLMLLEGPERNLVTGVYSWDHAWVFPDVRAVPFFLHPATPAPTLTPGADYEAVYVAIDKDRWITYLDSAKFTVPA